MKQLNKIHPTFLFKKSLYYAECWITALPMYNPNPQTNKKMTITNKEVLCSRI